LIAGRGAAAARGPAGAAGMGEDELNPLPMDMRAGAGAGELPDWLLGAKGERVTLKAGFAAGVGVAPGPGVGVSEGELMENRKEGQFRRFRRDVKGGKRNPPRDAQGLF